MDFEPPKESSVLKQQDWPQKQNRANPFWVVLYTLVGVGTFFYFNQDTDLVRDLKSVAPNKPVQELLDPSALQPAAEWVEDIAPGALASSEWIGEIAGSGNKEEAGLSTSKPEAASTEPPPQVQKTAYDPAVSPGKRPLHTLNTAIHHSLSHTLCSRINGTDCKRLSAYVARLLSWFLDVSQELRKGDTLSMIYEDLEGEERFRILKLVYQSRFLKETIEANYYKSADMQYGSYFDASGREIFPRLKESHAPIRRYEAITSLPGDYRRGKVDGHHGTDFKAPVGTPVYASFDGQVRRVNWARRHNGFCVEIVHPNEGVRTLYLHLDRVLVLKNEFVKRGQQIGTSGNTGRSFAPHLHYELHELGGRERILNPFQFKHHPKYVRRIAGEALSGFRKRVQDYDTLLKAPSVKQADVPVPKETSS